MKTISLTNSDEVTTVSDDDYDAVSAHKWFLKYSHSIAYVCRSVTHKGHRVKTIRLHRFIVWRMAGDLVDGRDIHHADHDTFNNQRENLSILEHEYHTVEHNKHRVTTEIYNDVIPF